MRTFPTSTDAFAILADAVAKLERQIDDLRGTTLARSSRGLASDRAVRTAGDVTLNSLTWADVDTGLDLTVQAAVGDVLLVALSARAASETVIAYLDVATIVGGSPVNYISGGAGGASSEGVEAWLAVSGASALGGSVQYVVDAGDIESGVVTLRLRYRTDTAANKTLRATSDRRVHFSVVNVGQ